MSSNSHDHLRLMKSSLLITLISAWGPYVACLPGSDCVCVKAVASWNYRKMAGEPRQTTNPCISIRGKKQALGCNSPFNCAHSWRTKENHLLLTKKVRDKRSINYFKYVLNICQAAGTKMKNSSHSLCKGHEENKQDPISYFLGTGRRLGRRLYQGSEF